ncbi:MAG: hypothetical protein M0T84_08130 [Betaproteobacteria bacterium]|nr:hypothetical protein [Betaproteobacteria bacterium]
MADYRELSLYRRCVDRIVAQWADFGRSRAAMLAQQGRFGKAPEKTAENIVGTLLTSVLGWDRQDLNWQLARADLVITRNFVKYLVVETKRPGSLDSAKAVDRALTQAWRYADEQRVSQVAVCDGFLLYGADIGAGGLQPRLVCDLSQITPPHEALWWISLDGIYRPCGERPDPASYWRARQAHGADGAPRQGEAGRLHPRHGLPASCFAYVGDPDRPATWKLPFLTADGAVDLKRLPMAIQALATTYRGARVGGIPDAAIPGVFRRLARAAQAAGKLPSNGLPVAPAYQRLEEILGQLEAAGR